MTKEELVRQLACLARRDARDIPYTDRFSFLSSFVARRTETVQAISMPVAGLLLVLEGEKTIVWAGRTYRFGPASAFVLPEGAYVDVVNEPDPRTGVYRAVFLGFSSALLAEARRRWSALAAGHVTPDPTVALEPALCAAILHTCVALVGADEVSQRIVDHRLQEVLLILAEGGAAPLRPDLRSCSMTDAVRAVIRNDPARAWEVGDVAAELGTTDPTLRRNLRQEGTGFRALLAEERMRVARMLLIAGRSSVAEAAQTGGYASLSHFTKRYFSLYGHLPSKQPISTDESDAA